MSGCGREKKSVCRSLFGSIVSLSSFTWGSTTGVVFIIQNNLMTSKKVLTFRSGPELPFTKYVPPCPSLVGRGWKGLGGGECQPCQRVVGDFIRV